MAPLALPHCIGLPYWHFELVLSWYLHQPESQRLGLSDGRTSGPKYWTPGLPGSDKNWGANKRQIEVPIKEKIGARRKVFGAMRTGTAVVNYGARYFDLLCHILVCFAMFWSAFLLFICLGWEESCEGLSQEQKCILWPLCKTKLANKNRYRNLSSTPNP